ncbi:MAG: hypothetical protein CMJ40_01165 [Phycisphaerae bacterium]|nr:hypothetical protein [Phycisphaerae bacterium]
MTRDDEPGILSVMITSILQRRAVALKSIIMVVVLLGVMALIVLLFAGERDEGVRPSKAGQATNSLATSSPQPVQPIQPAAPAADEIPDEDKPEAEAHFEPASLRLGYVLPESVITSEFTLVNDSDEPLLVKEVKRGCSCTEVTFQAGEIPPGGSRKGLATFTAGMTPTTKNNKVRILFEKHRPMTLPMNAMVSRAVHVQPPNFRMHAKSSFDGPVARTASRVQLSSTDSQPFRVLSSGGRPPIPVSGGGNPSEPSTAQSVMIDIGDYDKETLLDPQGNKMPPFWIIETDHPDAPVIEVRIMHREFFPHRREKEREWVFVENRVVVDAVDPGEAVQFELPIIWNALEGQRTQQIIAAESNSPQFEASLVGMKKDGRKSKAVIEIRPVEGVVGPYQGRIELVSHEHRAPLPVIGHVNRTGSQEAE